MRENGGVRVAVVPGPGQSGLLCELREDGTGAAIPVLTNDLVTAVREYELAGGVRWVWASAVSLYPRLLRAGVRIARCHDVALVDALLASRDGELPDPAGVCAAAGGSG